VRRGKGQRRQSKRKHNEDTVSLPVPLPKDPQENNPASGDETPALAAKPIDVTPVTLARKRQMSRKIHVGGSGAASGKKDLLSEANMKI
jgi:hypothetical protein